MAEKEYVERDELESRIKNTSNAGMQTVKLWNGRKTNASDRHTVCQPPMWFPWFTVDGSRMKTRKDIRVIRNVQHAKVFLENMIRTYASQGRTAFSTVPTAERRWTVRPTIMSVTKGGERE